VPPSPGASAFLDGLPEFGYVERQTIDIGVDVLLPGTPQTLSTAAFLQGLHGAPESQYETGQPLSRLRGMLVSMHPVFREVG
jgi:hypothetical protein